MSKKRDIAVVMASALLITGLFYKQPLGLNLLIAEILLFSWMLISKQIHFKGFYPISLSIGLLTTSLFTVLTHSAFSYIINFLTLFIWVGLLIYPNAKSLVSTIKLSFANIFDSQILFLQKVVDSKHNGRKFRSLLSKFNIFILPLLIIFLFIIIYKNSNPFFDKLISGITLFFQNKWSLLFENFNFSIIATFAIGLIVSIFLFCRKSNQKIIEADENANEELKRTRKIGIKKFRATALLNEYKSGVFLLVVLNLIILVLNVFDIKWVWFGFEWEGQYLKQFVHEGTYLLILSIVISVVLVLYYFRGNLNFYKKNRLLKYLSFIWIAQNGILTISVAIRNFWYIHFFALAYKRIGVIIFLILTLYGLYTVYRKVESGKSTFYLLKTNVFVILTVLTFSSLINWDTFIAKYNFKESNKSFLHLDYMVTLSDKSLPYLDKPLTELKQIDIVQKEKFPFEQKYMTPEEYHRIIERRKNLFIAKWEAKGFLSWNLPESMAYKKLCSDKCNNR